MDTGVPKYRFSTLKALPKSAVLAHFQAAISNPVGENADSVDCQDGSRIVFHESGTPGNFFIEFQCQFAALPEENGISFGMLNDFAHFCSIHQSAVKVSRNNNEIPPSFASLFSDLKWSLAFKRVKHLAFNPKDRKPRSG